MRTLENLRISIRYARMRLLESVLAVIGTTLGVAVIASAVTLIQAYNASAARELVSPIYRFIEISPRTSDRPTDAAIERVGPADADSPRLELSDISSLRKDVPAADQVFTADHGLIGIGAEGAFSYSAGKSAAGGPAFQVFTSRAPAGAGAKAAGDGPGVNAVFDAKSVTASAGPEGAVIEKAPAEPSLAPTLTVLVDEFDLVSVTDGGFAAWGVKLARGSLFTEQDQERGRAVVVLGAELAKRMFGDQDPLGGRFEAGGTVWTVVGILAPGAYSGPEKNDFNRWAFAPLRTPSVRLPGGMSMSLPTRLRSLTVSVSDPARLRAALDQVNAWVTRRFGEGAFEVRSLLREAEQSRANHMRLFIVIGAIAGAALLISSITLLNLMTTRTLRRARGIGIFRSLGATAADVSTIFLGESLAVTLLGGGMGAVIAPLLYELLRTQLLPTGWGVDLAAATAPMGAIAAAGAGARFDWIVMATSVLGAIVLNLLFAVAPALRASRASIVQAIRAE